MWHSNPLAGSPPPKRLQLAALPPVPQPTEQQQQQQQQQQQGAAGIEGATSARPLAAPLAEPGAEAWQELLGLQPSAPELDAAAAAEAAEAARTPSQPVENAQSQQEAALSQPDEEWHWVGSGLASSPSLRAPRSQQGGSASASEVAGSQASGAVQQQRASRPVQPALQLQPEASEGSTGGGEGGVASLSQRWDLPSPLGAGNS